VWPFSEGKRGRRRGGSKVLEADNKTKSGTTAGVWRSKVIKENWVGELNAWLGRTVDWGLWKNMAESMRWVRKIEEGILMGQNEKKEIKIWKDFWASGNWNFDSNSF
jgi:hypothetical protein